ncbi:hypothetical protein PTKIN_Ptkin06aG0127700 [Pterospermum kingtungense]
MAENLKKRKRDRKTKSSSSAACCSVTAREKILLDKCNFSALFTYVSCEGRKGQRLKFSRVFLRQSIGLVSSTLFRPLPHSSHNVVHEVQFGESFYIKGRKAKNLTDAISFQDPAWPDLDLVYRFLVLLLNSPRTDPLLVTPYIQPSFILNLLGLFQSEDARERAALVSVLQLLYQKFKGHRKFIRKSVFNIFYCCVNEKHNGIPDLLLFLRSVVEEEENDLGVQEESKLFLVRGLIPLYKSKRLALFSSHLNSCIEKFVETDCKLAETVLQGMLRHWPVAGSSREYFFLDGVERVLLETKPHVFQQLIIPLFHRIATCLSSPHHMVAEKGLSLFKIHGNIQKLIKQNLDVILPIIFTDLETSARNHWRPQIQKLAHGVCFSLLDMDPELFESCWIHMT